MDSIDYSDCTNFVLGRLNSYVNWVISSTPSYRISTSASTGYQLPDNPYLPLPPTLITTHHSALNLGFHRRLIVELLQ